MAKPQTANKDFKPRPTPARKGGGLLLGLFVGFLLGLGVAAAIAMYLVNTPMPFMARGASSDHAADPASIGKVAKGDDAKQHFDFYRILPGQEQPVTDSQLKGAAQQPAAGQPGDQTGNQAATNPTAPAGQPPTQPGTQVASAQPPASPGQPATQAVQPAAPELKDNYFIQAGAFQNPAEADNLKAKLALLGLEAGVEPSETPDKGTWYRVRLGPFSTVADINRVRGQLSQNGIEASLLKVDNSAPKP